MKLNEIVESNGLEKISDKTNISEENLESLINEDFKELNRAKALGFIAILKREYSAELDELEVKVKEYYNNYSEDDGRPILASINQKKSSSGLIKWLIIFGLLCGFWYLYSSGNLDSVLSNNSEIQENILADDEALKSNVNDDSVEKIKVNIDEDSKSEVIIESVEKTEEVVEENSGIDSEVDANVTDVVKISKEEEEAKPEKDAKSIAEEIEIEKAVDEVKKESIEEDSKIEKESVDEVIIEGEQKITDSQEAEIIYTVTVNPRVNLWFGFININTKERKEFMTAESRSIDIAAHKWILVTGHGRVSVASENQTLNINDRVKHFFYMDSSEMKEISRSEFRELNNGKGW